MMNNITYSTGTKENLIEIAQLHAQSWQDHYRGSLRDDYLDGPVFDERLEFWTKRFEEVNENQYILLAKSEEELIGFGCLFLNKDANYGSLIDNLHVSKKYKGHGIGRQLMEQMMEIIKKNAQSKSTYLWVLIKNKGAINFYKKIGGKIVEMKELKIPGAGSSSEAYRILWT